MSKKRRRKFKPPRKKKSGKKKGSSKAAENVTIEEQYWSCNYTDFSRKKHKNWMTGFSVIKGQSFQLFDACGKFLRKKTIAPKKWESGLEIVIGGKQIELDDKIAKEDFESGVLFEKMDSDEEEEDAMENKFRSHSNKRWEKFQEKIEEKKKKKEKRKKRAKKRKKAKKLGVKISLSSSEEEEEEEELGGANKPLLMGSRVRKPFKKVIPKGMKRMKNVHPAKIERVPSRSYILDQKTNTYMDQFLSRTVRPHQLQAIQFMYDSLMGYKLPPHQGCLLGDEMGAGKTLSVLSLLYTLLRRGHPKKPSFALLKKIVIVTPSSLVSHWASEIGKWFGQARIKPLVVSGKTYNKDPKDLINDFGFGYFPIMIISYSLCVHYAESLSHLDSKGKIQCLVCDEAHRLKSDQNRIYRTLYSLKTRKRILITGTPIQNNLEEFFCVLDFMAPGILDKKGKFKNYFIKPILKSKEKICSTVERQTGRERCEELNKIVSRVMLRRKMKNVLRKDLPRRNVYVVFLRLVTIQQRCYIRLLERNEMSFANNDFDDDEDEETKRERFSRMNTSGVLALVQKMKKLLAHPSLVLSLIDQGGKERDEDEDDDDEEEEEEEDERKEKLFPRIFPTGYNPNEVNVMDSCKFIKLSELLRSFDSVGDKTIIVSNFTRILDQVELLLNHLGLHFVRLDGSVPSIKRPEIVSRFQNPRNKVTKVFLLSSRAGGVGLNLTAANRLILLDPDWNPAIDSQAMARIYRDGQKKEIHIYRFVVSGTIEEKIFQRQMMKKGLGEGIVDKDDQQQEENNNPILSFGGMSKTTRRRKKKIQFTKEFLADLFSYDSTKKSTTFEISKQEEQGWKNKVMMRDRDGIGKCLDVDNSIVEYVKIVDEENEVIVEEDQKSRKVVSIDDDDDGDQKTGNKRKRKDEEKIDLHPIEKYFPPTKKKDEDDDEEEETDLFIFESDSSEEEDDDDEKKKKKDDDEEEDVESLMPKMKKRKLD